MIIAEEITAVSGGRKQRFCKAERFTKLYSKLYYFTENGKLARGLPLDLLNPRKEKNVLIDCEARRRLTCGC